MLRDRYDPMNLFALVADVGMQMDPILTQLDRLLEQDTLFQTLKADLACRHPRTLSEGRPSTPVEVILRLLVVKHLYGWSYEQTEHWVSDSLVLRQFCRVYAERVPDDTTILRWANVIRPETLHVVLNHVMDLARSLKVTRGRKLRIDGTVVQTNIHHPTDSSLLGDGVRVLSRLLKRAKQAVGATLRASVFRDQTRSAKRAVKAILDTVRSRGDTAETARKAIYQRLLQMSQVAIRQSQRVIAALQPVATNESQQLVRAFEQTIAHVQHVMNQTTRRVMNGESVPAAEKLVSLFEPHTCIIRKDKRADHTAFGRMIWLNEVEGGLVSRYAVLPGNPSDAEQVRPSLEQHCRQFHRPPRLLTGDRGTFSSAGERFATEQGVKQVVLPKPGAKTAERLAYERQPWFRRGRNWRAGIEGRISGLKRRHKLDRCRYHGEAGMERWVGWGILAHDLRMIAQSTVK